MARSRYAEKRHHAECAYCNEPATTLRIVRGSPEWLCPHHAGILDKVKTS